MSYGVGHMGKILKGGRIVYFNVNWMLPIQIATSESRKGTVLRQMHKWFIDYKKDETARYSPSVKAYSKLPADFNYILLNEDVAILNKGKLISANLFKQKKGSGWHKEPRKHREAAVKGQRKKRRKQ